jgi:hypothetical protein
MTKSIDHDAEQPLFWTAIRLCSSEDIFPEMLSNALLPRWYVDMNDEVSKIIVFYLRVFYYVPGDVPGKH